MIRCGTTGGGLEADMVLRTIIQPHVSSRLVICYTSDLALLLMIGLAAEELASHEWGPVAPGTQALTR